MIVEEYKRDVNPCYGCDCWDEDMGCTMSPSDREYACDLYNEEFVEDMKRMDDKQNVFNKHACATFTTKMKIFDDVNENKLYFSDDKTTFSFVGDDGMHINTTGHEVDPNTLTPHTMICSMCGKVFNNVTMLTLPSPCECGSIFFEGEKDYMDRVMNNSMEDNENEDF